MRRETERDRERQRERQRETERDRDRETIDNAQLSKGVGRGKGTSDGSKGRRHLWLLMHEHYGLAPLLHLSLEPPVQLLGRQLPQAFTACGSWVSRKDASRHAGEGEERSGEGAARE